MCIYSDIYTEGLGGTRSVCSCRCLEDEGHHSSGWLIALHAQADGALHSRDLGRPSPTFLSTYKFCKYNSKRLIHTTI